MQVVFGGMLVGLTLMFSSAGLRPNSEFPPPPAGGQKAAESLEGTYTVVSGERDGKALPESDFKGSVVRISGDKITGTDKDRKEFFSAGYKLDAAKKPWKISMKSTEPKEATAKGLVKKEGDTLTIIYALPGGDEPTEFKAKKNQQMFVLKPMKDPLPNNKFPPAGP